MLLAECFGCLATVMGALALSGVAYVQNLGKLSKSEGLFNIVSARAWFSSFPK